MEEIVQKLLDGNFKHEQGNLEFSCSRLELSLTAGECREGTFRIRGTENEAFYGSVSSNDLRMECLDTEFSGNGEEIPFRFHAENLTEGDVVKGEFYVVSNQGESYLPFLVTVQHTVIESSLGEIRNLFHFANLAKANWKEALEVFYSAEFSRIFEGTDRQFYDAYRGLSRYPGNEQNMEEFLLYINKKQKVEYSAEEKKINLENPEEKKNISLTLIRDGWGYTGLKVEIKGDFLALDRDFLSDSDFPGNRCRLQIQIRKNGLHAGNNFGQIRFYNPYTDIRVPVLVNISKEDDRVTAGIRKERQDIIVQMMEYYLQFRTKKISSGEWQRKSVRFADRLVSVNGKDLGARLFQAQLLITAERYNEAGWILNHTEELLTGKDERSQTLRAYYLYLCTLIRREDEYVRGIAEEVTAIYKEYPDAWRVAWLLLYLCEEYERSGSKRWRFLEEQYDRGCRSPILYAEALQMLHNNPTLLMRLSDFEEKVLLFGAEREYFSRDLIDQILSLTEREKEFRPLIFRILKACYRIQQGDEALKAICTYLIKGGKTGAPYFEWYRKAVDRQLRITNLYDYYMLSVDPDSEELLPRPVLMYFSYYSNLDYEHNACLFSNVYRYREQIPELYEEYRGQMESFLVEQLEKGHINRNLAYLYKNVLTPEMLTGAAMEAYSRLVFMNFIKVEKDNITKAVVYQPKAGVEFEYPLTGGEGYVPLFGHDCVLLLEDTDKNRYITGIPHHIEKMMLTGRITQYIEKYAEKEIGFDVYVCEKSLAGEKLTPETEGRYRRIMESDAVDGEYKKEVCMALLQYYYDHDRIQDMDECLERVDISLLDSEKKGTMIRLLVLRGNYEKAYEWVEKYGPFCLDMRTLVRLCNYSMEKNEFVEDPFLLGLISYAFQNGKYDAEMIRYLALYYRGMTSGLRDIWKAAEAFEIDTYKLCERILIQMMFSGAFVGEREQIFRRYVQGGAKQDVEIAFLSQCSYDYFVNQKLMSPFAFGEIGRLFRQGEELGQVCKLAMLKYYSDRKEEINDENREILSRFLREMTDNGIFLNFFREYMGICDAAEEVADKTIVEYYTKPKTKVVIHYVLEDGAGQEEEYFREDMKVAFDGVYYKDFVLFFGENLQYYIMEESDDTEQLTESGTLQNSDISAPAGENRYRLTNDIVTSSVLQDYDTFDELVEEYAKKDFLWNRLFTLK